MTAELVRFGSSLPLRTEKEAYDLELRIEAAKEQYRAGFETIAVAAHALRSLEDCTRSEKDIYEHGCDLVTDSLSIKEAEHLGSDDIAKIREEVWARNHPPRSDFFEIAKDIVRPVKL